MGHRCSGWLLIVVGAVAGMVLGVLAMPDTTKTEITPVTSPS
jgi:hypothetical protein